MFSLQKISGTLRHGTETVLLASRTLLHFHDIELWPNPQTPSPPKMGLKQIPDILLFHLQISVYIQVFFFFFVINLFKRSDCPAALQSGSC